MAVVLAIMWSSAEGSEFPTFNSDDEYYEYLFKHVKMGTTEAHFSGSVRNACPVGYIFLSETCVKLEE